MPFHWNQVTWSWLNLCLQREEEVKDQWEEKPYEVECQAVEGIPWKTSRQDAHESSTEADFFSSLLQRGPPVYHCADWADKVCHYHIGGANSEREWDKRSATKYELSAAAPAPHRWDSSRLGKQESLSIPMDIFWSLLVGLRMKCLDAEGLGVCGSQCQHSGSRGTDYTGEA